MQAAAISLLLQILLVVLGSLWVRFAIWDFQKKHYFAFGFDVMMFVFNLLNLVNLIF